MNYIKPEVVLTANTTEAIQGSFSKGGIYLECNCRDYDGTVTAYEADE